MTRSIQAHRVRYQTIMLTRRGYAPDQIAEITGRSLPTIHRILRRRALSGEAQNGTNMSETGNRLAVDRFIEAHQ